VKQKVNLVTWKRKAHFQFFNSFEEPYYGVCVRVDCTAAYAASKRMGCSFFLYCLYQSLTSVQQVEAFRLRVEAGDAYLYDRIDGGSTLPRVDGTFGFGYYTFTEDMAVFMADGQREMERVRLTEGLERRGAQNLVRYSALPWIDFTSLSHARRFAVGDSCPWITFGKMTESAGRRSMPVSIHVHHAVVDGVDVGKYIEAFQARMDQE